MDQAQVHSSRPLLNNSQSANLLTFIFIPLECADAGERQPMRELGASYSVRLDPS